MHFLLAQAVAQVLREGLPEHLLSQRAVTALESLRADHAWVEPHSTTLIVEPPEAGGRWWSFAGDRLNMALRQWLKVAGVRCTADSLGITVLPSAGKEGALLQTEELRQAIQAVLTAIAADGPPAEVDDATRAMKFADAVPDQLLSAMARERFGVSEAAAALAAWPVKVRIVSPSTPGA